MRASIMEALSSAHRFIPAAVLGLHHIHCVRQGPLTKRSLWLPQVRGGRRGAGERRRRGRRVKQANERRRFFRWRFDVELNWVPFYTSQFHCFDFCLLAPTRIVSTVGFRDAWRPDDSSRHMASDRDLSDVPEWDR
ncbi:hypothetical protein C4D60_Mb04t18200 [Musa balbisiana]|uniref:Uncharacterized protein n=1 Tax=Musa balbisiana TaxID=52838 RepID=A0A4S8KCU7_MUSBA|nr:hypothetical protein C4D60_Mb04t18200 [Musa balbisiana]